MSEELNLVAFDCGNSSIRVILCHFNGSTVKSELVLQEPNDMVETDGYFYWDMDKIFEILKRGLSLAAKKVERIDSVGMSTWGCDFQFLNKEGNFMGKAYAYRNNIGEEQIGQLSKSEQDEMFFRTGILSDKINSVFMLKGLQELEPDVIQNAEKLLMVPDIFVYLFTGTKINEPCELSTTQMLDVRTMSIDKDQCKYAGVSPDIFSPIGKHGEKIANIKKDILEELEIPYDIPFVCVPSHDTASAAFAIPTQDEEYLFVSSGTWALIGAQCSQPIVNEKVLDSLLTNEGGAFGRTTLLRNSTGMFITQRLKSEYEKEHGKISWDDFTNLANEYKADVPTFDVNDNRIFNPANMVREIQGIIHPDQGAEDYQWPEILASTYRSLGDSYVNTLKMVMDITGKEYHEVYIVGGGSKNQIINQRCADQLQMKVKTCDMECTSVGNAVSQIAYFHPEYEYSDLRKIIKQSLAVKEYIPQ